MRAFLTAFQQLLNMAMPWGTRLQLPGVMWNEAAGSGSLFSLSANKRRTLGSAAASAADPDPERQQEREQEREGETWIS